MARRRSIGTGDRVHPEHRDTSKDEREHRRLELRATRVAARRDRRARRSVRSTYGSVAAPTASTAPAHRSDSSGLPSAVTSSRGPGSRPRRARAVDRPHRPCRSPPTPRARARARIATADASDATAGTGDQHRAVAGSQAVLLQRDDGHPGGEPGRPDRHRFAGRRPLAQRHDPVRPARAGIRCSRRAARRRGRSRGRGPRSPARERRVGARRRRGPARSMPGMSGLIRATLPSSSRRETVLVVDARPLDADLDLAVGQVVGGEVAHAATDGRRAIGSLGLLSDVGTERIGDR